MNDLNERLRGIDRLVPPDLWPSALAKADAGAVPSRPSTARRVALIAAALTVGLTAIAWVFVAFRPSTEAPILGDQPVLSPAPRTDCPIGLVRSPSVSKTEFLRLSEGYAPTWMPEGFGVLATFGPDPAADGFAAHGVWSDARCRLVEFMFNPNWVARDHSQPDPRASVGPWVVGTDVPDGCGNAILGEDESCLRYSTVTADGLLSLAMMGLDRSEGDRIALSIVGGSENPGATEAATQVVLRCDGDETEIVGSTTVVTVDGLVHYRIDGESDGVLAGFSTVDPSTTSEFTFTAGSKDGTIELESGRAWVMCVRPPVSSTEITNGAQSFSVVASPEATPSVGSTPETEGRMVFASGHNPLAGRWRLFTEQTEFGPVFGVLLPDAQTFTSVLDSLGDRTFGNSHLAWASNGSIVLVQMVGPSVESVEIQLDDGTVVRAAVAKLPSGAVGDPARFLVAGVPSKVTVEGQQFDPDGVVVAYGANGQELDRRRLGAG